MIRIFIGYDEGEKIDFHVLSESIRRKTIIDSITVTANDILSPESQGINKLISIRKAVANVGTIILIL